MAAGVMLAPVSVPGRVDAQTSDDLSSITADTGDLAQGRQAFERYSHPSMCIASANPGACVRHFTVTATAPDDLLDLMLAALLGGNDPLASAAADRRLSLATTDSGRAEVVTAAMARYLAVESPRVASAEALASRAETLFTPGHPLLAVRPWQQLLAHAVQMLAWDRTERYSQHILSMIDRLPTSRETRDIFVAVSIAQGQRMYAAYPDSFATFADRTVQAYGRFLSTTPTSKSSPHPSEGEAPAPVKQLRAMLDPGANITPASVDVNAAFRFPGPPPTSPSRSAPVTVILSLVPEWQVMWNGEPPYPQTIWDRGCLSDSLMAHGSWAGGGGEWCHAPFSLIEQLTQRYGGQGLSILLVVPNADTVFGRTGLTPAQRAERFDWVLRGRRKLPVTLAVGGNAAEAFRRCPVTVVNSRDERVYQVCELVDLPKIALHIEHTLRLSHSSSTQERGNE